MSGEEAALIPELMEEVVVPRGAVPLFDKSVNEDPTMEC